MTTNSEFRGCRNGVLRALPKCELAVLEPYLEPAAIRPGEVIQAVGQVVDYLYFVEDGMVSYVSVLGEGEVFEVAPIGAFGMMGIGVLRLDQLAVFQGVGQIEGQAFRVSGQHFREVWLECPKLREETLRQRDLVYAVAARSAACLAHHDLRSRLARWLLQVTDVVEMTDFKMKQECIAQMLGVCRPTLSVAAHALQEAGVIRFVRGRIEVLDPDSLKRMACRCYLALRQLYRPFLGAGALNGSTPSPGRVTATLPAGE